MKVYLDPERMKINQGGKAFLKGVIQYAVQGLGVILPQVE